MVDRVHQSVEKVTVEGPRSLVDQVASIAAYFNMNGRKEDVTMGIPLVALNTDGKEVQGLTLYPDTMAISVKLTRGLQHKVVEVQAKPRSDLPPQLKLESVTVQPARIEITGTKEALDKVTGIETEAFSLADVKESGTQQVKLHLPAGVTATNPTVTVEIKVGAMQ